MYDFIASLPMDNNPITPEEEVVINTILRDKQPEPTTPISKNPEPPNEPRFKILSHVYSTKMFVSVCIGIVFIVFHIPQIRNLIGTNETPRHILIRTMIFTLLVYGIIHYQYK